MAAGLLLLIGGIIAIGFLGDIFFEKTRIPDTLLLIGIGLLLGPVFRMIPPETVRPYMSTFGAIALTIILFEGGLDLDIRNTVRQAGRAFLLAGFSFIVTIFLIYYALAVGFGARGATAWALAAALACTSAPIVIPVLGKLMPDSPMRPLLAVESSLSDAFAVMTVLAVLGLEGEAFSGAALFGKLGAGFLGGGLSALVAGIFWLWLLGRLYSRKYFYLMTVGFVFLLMGAIEALHWSGSFAVLIFGIVLANGETLFGLFGSKFRERLRKLFAEGAVALHPGISRSHAEISFLIRSFFFVYLGMIFRWPGSNMRMWLTILLVAAAIIAGRRIAVQLTAWTVRIPVPNRGLLRAMIPRGLATAVLASLLVPNSSSESPPWETLAMFMVVITNMVMTARLARIRGIRAARASGE